MKLKYYLRGLGIGILVTALLMGVSGRKQLPLTDAEIKAKAATLGMVESSMITLSQVQQMQDSEPESTEPESTEPESTEPESTEPESTEPESTELESTEPESTEPESSTESAEPEAIIITIKSGSGSGTVCRQLQEAGIIEDSGELDRYLMEKGYATRICVGSFEIPKGSSKDEIARIITGSNK